MGVYGINDNKGLVEIYSKKEIDDKYIVYSGEINPPYGFRGGAGGESISAIALGFPTAIGLDDYIVESVSVYNNHSVNGAFVFGLQDYFYYDDNHYGTITKMSVEIMRNGSGFMFNWAIDRVTENIGPNSLYYRITFRKFR